MEIWTPERTISCASAGRTMCVCASRFYRSTYRLVFVPVFSFIIYNFICATFTVVLHPSFACVLLLLLLLRVNSIRSHLTNYPCLPCFAHPALHSAQFDRLASKQGSVDELPGMKYCTHKHSHKALLFLTCQPNHIILSQFNFVTLSFGCNTECTDIEEAHHEGNVIGHCC